MIKVRFIYSGDNYNIDREKVIENICRIVSTLIQLPKELHIEFKNLPKSVQAEACVQHQFKNRIRLNETVTPKEVIKPLIHELIHINQLETGVLSCTRDGFYIWKNKLYNNYDPNTMEISDYEKLPWEQDVANKQHILLEKVLEIGLSKT